MIGSGHKTRNVTDAVNEFSLLMSSAMHRYAQDYTEQPNTVSSAFSLWSALVLAALGAEGRTRDQLEEALCLRGLSLREVAETYEAVHSHVDSLRVKNLMLAHQEVVPTEEYLRDINQIDVDFWSCPFNADTVNRLNDWVSQATDGMIQGILDGFHPLDRILLVNAIHFKAEWATHFTEAIPSRFLSPWGEGRCNMMKIENQSFGYNEGRHGQMVVLPYDDRETAMVLVLPPKGVDQVTSTKTLMDDFLRALTSCQKTAMELYVPRFSIEMDLQEELMTMLREFGVEDAFGDTSDFSRMANVGSELYISRIIQKARIDVDETGTEAAAVTSVMLKMRGLAPETLHLRFDRPFTYFIIDVKSKMILFSGWVNDPGIV